MDALADIAPAIARVRSELDRVVIGQEAAKDHLLACLFAGGHALLEGVPGTGKTLLALALARLVGCRFGRVQFTPDLMPADLLGTNVFDPRTQSFEFHPGPIFTDLLLADEVNRTPPRTQSALLEAMQEMAVTTDGIRRVISPAFTVIATQNPVEFEGTYPLPEAQRDRFLLKVTLELPSEPDERKLLGAYARDERLHDEVVAALQPVLSLDDLVKARRTIARGVRADDDVQAYILRIVRATRSDADIHLGAGPRAGLALLSCSRVLASMRGRDFVNPDDVKALAAAVLAHRVNLTPEAEMESLTLEDVLSRIFEQVEVPR